VTTTAPPAPVAPPPPPRRPKRSRYIVAMAGCVVAVVAVIVLSVVLSQNVVYYKTVSEAVRERKDQGSDRFRIAGAVVPGSIRDNGTVVRFRITDGKNTASVVHHGDRPVLFKNGAPVLCEGHWAATATSAPFDSDRILIKHGSNYSPPKVDTKNAPKGELSS